MSKFDELLELYTAELKSKAAVKKVDAELLRAVAKACGPSLYTKDGSTVACSDKAELERVKKNFLIKKLHLADSPKLDEAIQEVCQQVGSSNRNKYRAMFYYLLVKKFRKSGLFVG